MTGKSMIYGCIGFAYGFGLMVLSIGAAGFGHGTYVLMGLSSAPLSILSLLPRGDFRVLIALLGTPVLWLLIGFLLGLSPSLRRVRCVLVVMAVHYSTALLLLLPASHSEFSDWSYVPKVQGVFIMGIVFYVIGQAFVWLAFFRDS